MIEKPSSNRRSGAISPALRILLVSGCLACSMLSADAELTSEARQRLRAASIVEWGVVEALDNSGEAHAAISLTLPENDPRYAAHPTSGSEVHPLVFELVNMALPGPKKLEELGSLHVLSLTLDVNAVLHLLENPDIVGIDLADDEHQAPAGKLPPMSRASSCVRTTTTTCLHSFRFSVSVTHGGITSTPRSNSQESAIFSTYHWQNWEVLAKLLDGCAINGHYWFFSAGATDVSYNVYLTDHDTSTSRSYINASCPEADIKAFSCN